MKSASLGLLREIIALGGDAATIAAAVVKLELGDRVVVNLVDRGAPKTSTERSREARAKARAAARSDGVPLPTATADATGMQRIATADATLHATENVASVSPLVLSPLSPISAETEIKEEKTQRENTRDATPMQRAATATGTATGTRDATPNATRDGACGMAVSAWCEGIKSVTGVVFIPPTGSPLRQLLESFKAHRPEGAEVVAWARDTAAEYARARKGQQLSAAWFAEWLGSGKPERGSGVLKRVREVQPGATDGGKSAWEIRDEERRRQGSQP